MKRKFSGKLAFALITAFILCHGMGALAQPAARSVDGALTKIAVDSAAAESKSFRFIVIGDNRVPYKHYTDVAAGKMEPFQPEDFHRAIAESNVLQPAFVINVGDLILGHMDIAIVQKEWDNYLTAIAASKPPFVSVVGNHDIWDDESRRIFQERIGPFYFSFDYGNSHFIALNSEEPALNIGQAQFDWLKADLESHENAENIFVVLHQPYFDAVIYSNSNWAEVHSLLKQYPVRGIFAGHFHLYRKHEPRDGIEYVITGGGGAEPFGTEAQGGFHHYLLVNVNGKQISWAVIKPGAILPADCVKAPPESPKPE